jgi:hypothetical protein
MVFMRLSELKTRALASRARSPPSVKGRAANAPRPCPDCQLRMRRYTLLYPEIVPAPEQYVRGLVERFREIAG